ncbi:MAG: flagellar basal body P-ring formation chaperone FlgA [Gammaproteobacteria bacterium]
MTKRHPKRRYGLVKALTISVVLAQGAAASEWQDVKTIRQSALDHAQSIVATDLHDIVLSARDVDPRLRLRRCSEPLEAYLPPGATLTRGGVVGVRCSAPVGWKIFVPVGVARHALVARTTRALPAGHRLTANDVEWVRKTLNATDAVLIKKRDQAVGKILRQPSAVGQVIRSSMLRAPFAIRRGERVTLAVSNNGLAIRMRGEALANAALGQRIQARNDSSGRVVEGVVRAQGVIELDIY